MGNTLCVVLHYGSEEDTVDCLDTLALEEDIEIVVSDNDPSQSLVLPERFSGIVRLFRTGGSLGFAHGNNVAVREYLNSSHDSILVINNDTKVKLGSIRFLRETLSHEGVGAVGPCMPYADPPYRIWACGGYINRMNLRIGGITRDFPEKPFEVDYLPGAAILCRAEVWMQVGGLPERYFLAYEEAEFALELKKLGFRVLVDPRAIVFHKVGMSGQSLPKYFYNSVRNRIIFSRYLYGDKLGFIFGLLVTSIGITGMSPRVVRLRLSLWWQAVIDDFQGVTLDKQRLTYISDQYPGSV